MKYDIFFGEINYPSRVLEELKLLFEVNDSSIVDQDGNVILNLDKRYFYRHEGQFYPIVNNITWSGDYYDEFQKLVCTPGQKLKAIREHAPSRQAMSDHIDFGGSLTSSFDILSHFVMDYYCSIRAYEVNDSYYETVKRLQPRYQHLVETDANEMDELINRMNRIADIAFPGLMGEVTDLAGSEDNAYSVLEFTYSDKILRATVVDDWRIREWKRLTVNGKVKEGKQRSRDMVRADTDIINQAIEKQKPANPEKPKKLPVSKHFTNFRQL